jgi:hypothetical protein
VNSVEISHQLRGLTYEEEVEEGPHSDGDSCRIVSRMNEDDEKLQTFVIEEKDQRSVLIVGGVEIFLPSGQGEASTYVVDVTEGHPAEIVMGEKEQILNSFTTEGQENST